MNLNDLYQKASNFEFLTVEEGMFLFEHAPLTELMFVADELRKQQVPHGKVTWQIDRNVNTTNVCIANCKFCNFFRCLNQLKLPSCEAGVPSAARRRVVMFKKNVLVLETTPGAPVCDCRANPSFAGGSLGDLNTTHLQLSCKVSILLSLFIRVRSGLN